MLAVRLRLGARACPRFYSSPSTSAWNILRPSRSRWQSTTPHDGPAISEANRAEATMKRFWKDVGIEQKGDQLAVTLDKRALKTPSGKTLLLPKNKSLVASLIAAEWDIQETVLKPHALPITSLASRAVDAMRDEQTCAEVRKALIPYLDTDTICFYQEEPARLVKLQTEHWDPLLEWAHKNFGLEITKSKSILSFAQPESTKRKAEEVMLSFDEWQMAAMERVTYTTKSFIIALALVQKHLSVEQAALAAQVEVNSQIELWGEVEDTHDVDYHDVRRQLGSAACILSTV